jgi:protein-S-isoprenylcysteine O-methyltransferase Ste14
MKILQWLELKIPPLIQVLVFALLMWIIHQNTSSLNDTGSIYLASTLFLISLIISLLAVFKFRTEETTVDPRTPNKTTGLVIRGIYSELM